MLFHGRMFRHQNVLLLNNINSCVLLVKWHFAISVNTQWASTASSLIKCSYKMVSKHFSLQQHFFFFFYKWNLLLSLQVTLQKLSRLQYVCKLGNSLSGNIERSETHKQVQFYTLIIYYKFIAYAHVFVHLSWIATHCKNSTFHCCHHNWMASPEVKSLGLCISRQCGLAQRVHLDMKICTYICSYMHWTKPLLERSAMILSIRVMGSRSNLAGDRS